MTYTERLVRRWAKGPVSVIPREEALAIAERLREATEPQRKADEYARAMSEIRARFKWLG